MRNTTLLPFLAFLFIGLAPLSAEADNQQGQACSPNGRVSGATKNGAIDDGNNLVCISGTWQYPAYALPTAAAAAGASCSGYPAGALRFNTTLSNIEFCNATTWGQIPAVSAACSDPSGLSFTNRTDQSLGAIVSSSIATITFSSCNTPYSVSLSGEASTQISINGGAWATSGTISSGQTLQVRMTTSASTSTTLTATITIGSVSANWTTTTRGSALKMFTTPNNFYGSSVGSLSAADAACQAAAGIAGYTGTYKAVLSDETTNAKDRLTLTYPIVNAYDATTIAATDLWSGTLATYAKTPSGTGASGVWTGTTASGTKSAGYTCNSWTGGTSGTFGYASGSYLSASWTAYTTTGCQSNNFSLYCIQQ